MTYDLHGQWDYGNNYSDVGCPGGNCLRSQVNSTETHTSLSMITKAGVPSNKIVVGVTSYGRSFQMTQSGCTGPMCSYTGPDSGATPGRCTLTAGYLAQAEIDEILQNDKTATTFYDSDSESDIMVYNDTQWVAYMSNNTRAARTATYLGWNFLGTVDWAIDLAAFSESETDEFEPLPDCNNAGNYHSIDDILNDPGIPDDCMNMYIMNAMSETISGSLQSYQDIMNDGYKGKYNAYAREVRGQGYWAWNDVWGEDQNMYWNCFQTNDGKNKTVSCGSKPGGSAYYYVLKDQDAFCNDMESKYNLDCDWITQQVGQYTDPGSGGIPCERYGDCPDDGTIYYPNLDMNFPVLDPSALITQSLNNYTGFSDWLGESAGAAQTYMFPPMDSDAVDASSMMVFSVQASVQAMQQVADVGEKAEEEQKKEMILAFITAFLLMVPGIGEAADGVAALAQVGRIAKLVDVAGNSAMGIYGAVEDPSSAPMAVAGILLGGLALRDESVWSKAATEARSMGEDVIKSMGDGVAAGVGKVKQTCKECSP
jgi:chitinase